MTPMEVVTEQVEPMLTLSTEDDINWTVVMPTTEAITNTNSVTSIRTVAAKPVGKCEQNCSTFKIR